jgi:sugar lactone lactonase YvrE
MTQLYVVNHGGRESVERFEVKQVVGTWRLIWHGCVLAKNDCNDVAALPDGGFAATHPTSLGIKGNSFFSGQLSGVVARWAPGKGEMELAGTKAGYPNGIVASSDGRYLYYAAWTAREVHKYDLKVGSEIGVVKLTFMPDNLTWTKKGQILAAGVKGVQGDCPSGSGAPYIQGVGVAVIDPGKMQAKTVFDSQGKGALISGVSVALQVKDSIYVGGFQGNRLLRIHWKE